MNRYLALTAACLAILATGNAFAAPIPAYVVHAVKDEARPSAA